MGETGEEKNYDLPNGRVFYEGLIKTIKKYSMTLIHEESPNYLVDVRFHRRSMAGRTRAT